jgi:hypothetical protein
MAQKIESTSGYKPYTPNDALAKLPLVKNAPPIALKDMDPGRVVRVPNARNGFDMFYAHANDTRSHLVIVTMPMQVMFESTKGLGDHAIMQDSSANLENSYTITTVYRHDPRLPGRYASKETYETEAAREEANYLQILDDNLAYKAVNPTVDAQQYQNALTICRRKKGWDAMHPNDQTQAIHETLGVDYTQRVKQNDKHYQSRFGTNGTTFSFAKKPFREISDAERNKGLSFKDTYPEIAKIYFDKTQTGSEIHGWASEVYDKFQQGKMYQDVTFFRSDWAQDEHSASGWRKIDHKFAFGEQRTTPGSYVVIESFINSYVNGKIHGTVATLNKGNNIIHEAAVARGRQPVKTDCEEVMPPLPPAPVHASKMAQKRRETEAAADDDAHSNSGSAAKKGKYVQQEIDEIDRLLAAESEFV